MSSVISKCEKSLHSCWRDTFNLYPWQEIAGFEHEKKQNNLFLKVHGMLNVYCNKSVLNIFHEVSLFSYSVFCYATSKPKSS